MNSTIEAMLSPKKGLLAADESFPTIKKRFDVLNIPSTEQTRRDYRELLFTTPELNRFISGVILFEETTEQSLRSGQSMVQFLADQGIVPGIKVDRGTVDLAGFPEEKVTEGLDGLRERLAGFYAKGARFAKWRAVISAAENLPTSGALEANAHALARYAALCQEAKLVPIVEPEVLMTGAHTLARCEEVTELTLQTVFRALTQQRVKLEEILLKSGMVIPGDKCPERSTDDDIARATLRCFRRSVPAAVPGIVFLSGGQSPDDATRHLDAICKDRNVPWKISFSYGRALQDDPLSLWKGDPKNVTRAQKALSERAERNSQALHDR